MRKIIYITFFSLVLFSCETVQNTVYVSYNKYGDFFITESNSVNFSYQPIGSIVLSIENYPREGNNMIKGEKLTPSLALDLIIKNTIEKAKEKGANGFINFSYAPIESGGVLKGWVVSGMAINIK